MTCRHITCTLHSRWTIDWKKKKESILYSKVNTWSPIQVPWFRKLLLFCVTHWYWTSRISTNASIAAKFTKLFCALWLRLKTRSLQQLFTFHLLKFWWNIPLAILLCARLIYMQKSCAKYIQYIIKHLSNKISHKI